MMTSSLRKPLTRCVLCMVRARWHSATEQSVRVVGGFIVYRGHQLCSLRSFVLMVSPAGIYSKGRYLRLPVHRPPLLALVRQHDGTRPFQQIIRQTRNAHIPSRLLFTILGWGAIRGRTVLPPLRITDTRPRPKRDLRTFQFPLHSASTIPRNITLVCRAWRTLSLQMHDLWAALALGPTAED